MSLAILTALALLNSTAVHSVSASEQQSVELPPLQKPDAACASCHAAIYAKYEQTHKARGSGTALGGLLPGEFTHAASGVHYRVFRRDGRAWMSFAREASAGGEKLNGERELLLFVGSGTHGRTYLYRVGTQWFELPVNYYGRRDRWDMAPAYDNVTRMPGALPVDANCMHCHASAVETPAAQARNSFPVRPFDQGGIGCSACHGDPSKHLAAGGHGPIVSPAHLSPVARDSVCLQCHLEGDATVSKPGRSLAQFRPGALLSDFAVYFVRARQAAGGGRASSQYEALLQSACKRASGDRLTCTTCHDPHSEPAAADRVAYFRARCLACHIAPEIATAHHPEQQDCAACHMPSRATTDISHEQATDHNIQARPTRWPVAHARKGGQELVAVGGVAASDRDLGLAYAQVAEHGDEKAAGQALQLLERAVANGADDVQVHVVLGYLEQRAGDTAKARAQYAAALREDPYDATALTDRAVLDASKGDLGEAVRLLDRLIKADPSQTRAGLDLAFLECKLGETRESRELAERLADLNPDLPELRLFSSSGTLGGRSCAPTSARR